MKTLITLLLILSTGFIQAQTTAQLDARIVQLEKSALNQRLTSLEKSTVDTATYNKSIDSVMRKRVNDLQGWVNDVRRQINVQITALQTQITAIQNKPDNSPALQAEIEALKLRITNLKVIIQ
jgi:conjugal transfer/entry exclusion protein